MVISWINADAAASLRPAIRRRMDPEVPMADQDDDMTVVPIPASETEAEHRRIRSSNDRDQKAEREGKKNRHNEGYDEAADGKTPEPRLERVVDEL